jgi:hypothetical protein
MKRHNIGPEPITPIPDNWAEVVGLQSSITPSPVRVTEALRTLADALTVIALIADLKRAIDTLEQDPNASEAQKLMVRRYRPAIYCLMSDGELLIEKMRQDYEKGRENREIKETGEENGEE